MDAEKRLKLKARMQGRQLSLVIHGSRQGLSTPLIHTRIDNKSDQLVEFTPENEAIFPAIFCPRCQSPREEPCMLAAPTRI